MDSKSNREEAGRILHEACELTGAGGTTSHPFRKNGKHGVVLIYKDTIDMDIVKQLRAKYPNYKIKTRRGIIKLAF